MTSISVIIVSHNCCEDLRRCVSSLSRECEIIVVDNASTDGSSDMIEREFPAVTLIRNQHNRGFGPANNQGLRRASGNFVLLLNPDAFAHPSAIELLASFLESNPKAVACGGRLMFPDGRFQESASNALTLWVVFCEQTYLEKLLPHSRLFSPYWVSGKHRSSDPLRVAQVMGACLMMRRIQGQFLEFDERFFLYCEDTELCKRLSKYGEIWYVPTAVFTHALGRSAAGERWKAVSYYNRGKELYFAIHHGKAAAALCFLINRFGALLRFLAWSFATVITLGALSRPRYKAFLFFKVLFSRINPFPFSPSPQAASKASSLPDNRL